MTESTIVAFIFQYLVGLDCTSTADVKDILRDKGAPYDIAAVDSGYLWEMYWINEKRQVVEVFHVENESRFPEYQICVSQNLERPFVVE